MIIEMLMNDFNLWIDNVMKQHFVILLSILIDFVDLLCAQLNADECDAFTIMAMVGRRWLDDDGV